MTLSGHHTMLGGVKLPYDAEVEYLESAGTQWIDTGIDCRSLPDEFVVRCSASIVDLGQDFETIFGAERTASSYPSIWWRVQPYNYQGPGRQFMASAGSQRQWSSLNPTINVNYSFILDVKTTGVSYYINDARTNFSYPRNKDFRIPFNLYLFCLNNNGTPDRKIRIKLKGFSIDGIIDLIPVCVGTTGEMYDRVSGTFATRYGTFVVGPDVSATRGGGYSRQCVKRSHRRSSRSSARFWCAAHSPRRWEVAA